MLIERAKKGEAISSAGRTATAKKKLRRFTDAAKQRGDLESWRRVLMSLVLLACEAGYLVRYPRLVDLLSELHAGLADGSYERRLRRWARFPLVVLDETSASARSPPTRASDGTQTGPAGPAGGRPAGFGNRGGRP